MRLNLLSATCGIIVVAAATANAGTVGKLGDPSKWDVKGVTTLSPESVKRTLAFDFESLWASHPQASLAEFPDLLERRAVELFRHAGFPNARILVQVDEDTEHVEIIVHEGRRCVGNKIIVSGVNDSLAAIIETRLTSRYQETRGAHPQLDNRSGVLEWIGPEGEEVEAEKPLWKQGEPAPCDEITLKRIRSRVQESFEEVGFRAAQFKCRVVPRNGRADLKVEASSLGPPALVKEIEIVGNQLNSRDAILRYLKITPGVTFTGERRQQLLRALWESGRFATHRVTADPFDSGVKLKISVVEAPGVPPLSQRLTREAIGLLKCREWLTLGAGRSRDIVIAGKHREARFECILSNRGVLLTWSRQPDPAAAPDYALSFADDGIGLYEVVNGRKLCIKQLNLQLKLTTKLLIHAENPDRPFKISLGAGISSRKAAETTSSLVVRSSVAPVYYTVLATRDGGTAQWYRNILTLPVRNGLMVVNAETGELLAYQLYDKADNVFATAASVADRFEDRRNQLLAITANHENHYDPAAPISSIARFACTSSMPKALVDVAGGQHDQLQKITAALATLGLLVDHGVLDALDKSVVEGRRNSDAKDGLSIPSSGQKISKMQSIARVSVGLADHLFPRDSWPWTVWRETGFMLGGRTKYTASELKRVLASDDSGPLAHWLLTELFTRIKRDQLAVAIAAQGTQKLSRPKFHADCELLLGKTLDRLVPVVHWIGGLNERDRALLADLLSVEAQVLDQIANAVRDSSAEEAPAALLLVFDQLWINRWRELAKSRMSKIVSEKGPQVLAAKKKPLKL